MKETFGDKLRSAPAHVPPRAVRDDVSEERRGAAQCLWLDPWHRWGDEWKVA